MNLLPLIKSRRSTRTFLKKEIPQALLENITEAGRWAPSSMNRQPWRFVWATKEEDKQFFSKEAKQKLLEFLATPEAAAKWGADAVVRFKKRAEGPDYTIFYNAPAVLFVIETLDTGMDRFDHGMACMNMMLYAKSEGVSSCPIGLAEPIDRSSAARELLKMQPEEHLVIALVFGYPSEEPKMTERKEGVVRFL